MEDRPFKPIIDFELENKHEAIMIANKSVWFIKYDEQANRWNWWIRYPDKDIFGHSDSQEKARRQIVEELSK